MEIEKLKVDMDKCFDIYQILEDFNYKYYITIYNYI